MYREGLGGGGNRRTRRREEGGRGGQKGGRGRGRKEEGREGEIKWGTRSVPCMNVFLSPGEPQVQTRGKVRSRPPVCETKHGTEGGEGRREGREG